MKLHLEQLEDRLSPSIDVVHPLIQVAGALDNARTLYNPAQIAAYYKLDQTSFTTLYGNDQGNGAGQTIAIVDAWDSPTIGQDLALFDALFHLAPPPLFLRLNELGGTQLPNADPLMEGWEIETALDVEWAHALAPGANIVLVEANTPSTMDMLTAVHTAALLPTVGVVSMSWGGPETADEVSYDSYFQGHNVVFAAAAGDTAGQTSWPAVSPNVLAVGGTVFNGSSETGWTNKNGPEPGNGYGSGGGISPYEKEPSYQYSVQHTGFRSNPDISAVGGSLLPVVDTGTLGQYLGYVFGVYGTSAAAPQWAAFIALADQGRNLAGLPNIDGATQLLPLLYSLSTSNFNLVNGSHNYSLVTGLGSPVFNQMAFALGSQLPTPVSATGDLWAIPSEQFWALAYHYLETINPSAYSGPAQLARATLASNPTLYTPLGQLLDELTVLSLGV